VTQLKKISKEEGCQCVDVYSKLLPVWNTVSPDGINMNETGQQIVADMVIKEVLTK